MSLVDEITYATQFLSELSSRTVKYPADFAPPPQTRQKPFKAPGLSTKKAKNKAQAGGSSTTTDSSSSQAQLIKIKVKSIKGGQTYTVQATTTDSVLQLKENIKPFAQISPANQRLILKGKALTDTKTLAEYGITNDSTIHLVQKAGSVSGSGVAVATTTASSGSIGSEASTTVATVFPTTELQQLSPSGVEIAKEPQFWVNLRQYLQQQFQEAADAEHVFNNFLNVYKGLLGDLTSEDLAILAKGSAST